MDRSPRGFHDFVAETAHHAYRGASLAPFGTLVKPLPTLFRHGGQEFGIQAQKEKPRIAPGPFEFKSGKSP
ncbi:MAG: hypothetical protein EBT35_05365 [Alphaproteobacteria bacterium]|nr:hypothetical protein [Alphaproteobacteria bacterium]